MKKGLRQSIYEKFGGLCAYTGMPLDNDWQVDHLKPLIRKMKTISAHYINIDTGIKATESEIKEWSISENPSCKLKWVPQKFVPDGYVNPENHCLENMIPALKIINHYKRDLGLESFRRLISTLHIRLEKFPKETSRPETIRRKEYLLKVANAFGISKYNPFAGKFYFEENNKQIT